MNQLRSFESLFIHEIKTIFNAEGQWQAFLPRVIDAVRTAPLRDSLAAHREDTRRHLERLESIMDELGSSPRGRRCHCMTCLIECLDRAIVENPASPAVHDALVMLKVQQVQHFQLCAYRSARVLARVLLHDRAEALLETSSAEAKRFTSTLTDLSIDLYTTAEPKVVTHAG